MLHACVVATVCLIFLPLLSSPHKQTRAQKPPVFVNFRGSPKRDPRAHSLSASYVVKVEEATLGALQVGARGGRGDGAFFVARALRLSTHHTRLTFKHPVYTRTPPPPKTAERRRRRRRPLVSNPRGN
jgi:hypothetical protein